MRRYDPAPKAPLDERHDLPPRHREPVEADINLIRISRVGSDETTRRRQPALSKSQHQMMGLAEQASLGADPDRRDHIPRHHPPRTTLSERVIIDHQSRPAAYRQRRQERRRYATDHHRDHEPNQAMSRDRARRTNERQHPQKQRETRRSAPVEHHRCLRRPGHRLTRPGQRAHQLPRRRRWRSFPGRIQCPTPRQVRQRLPCR